MFAMLGKGPLAGFRLSDWPEQVTTYGGPNDPFRKVVDKYVVDDEGNVSIERHVFARGHVANINVEVSVSV